MAKRDWSRAEVEATVASYFHMLELGLAGERFSKTAHRNALLRLLDKRTPGAIERKHGNISAILIEEHVPYISGYKPYGNYQGLLREVVLDQLAARSRTRALIEAEAMRVPELPDVDDLTRILTSRPRQRPGMRSPTPRRGPSRAPVDYVLMEARNSALGRAGESFVLNLERARLEVAGKSRLAASIHHVSVERGDGLGYDILSFDVDSRERLIEVKTTKHGEYTPFYVSRNELEVSRQSAEQYHLYRVYSFGRTTRVFTVPGALDQAFEIEPSAYVARVG